MATAAAATQQLRERISFRQDQPTDIRLEGTGNPTEQPSRDGTPEYRYFLADRKIMWVPAEVHELIQRADSGQQAQFAITKHKAPKPWTVIAIEDEPLAARYAPEHRAPAPQPAPREAADLRKQLQPAPQAALPLAEAEDPYAASYYTCLCAAVRIAANAEKFGQQIGRALALDSQDVRTIATTLFIHATGGSR
jgi:hypothetical protein